jgi:putative effector of murein hydrolase LrgA (UPF0299 family)
MTDNELTLILTISFILILFVTAIISYLVFSRKDKNRGEEDANSN